MGEIKKYKDSEIELGQLLLPGISKKDKERYSSTAELYDILPKYLYSNPPRNPDGLLPAVRRPFEHRNMKYSLTIYPATIMDDDGESKAFYPTAREELVEDALRKIAIDKGGYVLQGDGGDFEVTVKTTIGEIKRELKKHGHEFKWAEIKESIQVCNSTKIGIKSEEGEVVVSAAIFPVIAYEDSKFLHEGTKVIIKFHPLVTKSVLEGSLRIINYEQFMKYRKGLSKWLHKRISHIFVQATVDNPYAILLSTIIRDSGTKQYKTLSDNIRQVSKCLDEMKKVGSLSEYEVVKIYDKDRTNKIVDAKFSLWLSNKFVSDVKKGNFVQKTIRGTKQEISNDQGELIDLKDQIRRELKRPDFELSDQFIEKYLRTITGTDAIESTSLALKAVLDTIDGYKVKGQSYRAAALAKKALEEKWLPQGYSEQAENEAIEEEEWGIVKDAKEQEKFNQFLTHIKHRVGESTFNSWFKFNLVSAEKELKLEVKNNFCRQELEEKYSDILQDATLNIYGLKSYVLDVK